MAALGLLLLISLAISHWLFEPLMAIGRSLFPLAALPWLLLALGAWLLAGRPLGGR